MTTHTTTSQSAQQWLDERVRDLVRTSGVDPQMDPEGLDSLIDQAIGEYEKLTVAGEVTGLRDEARVRLQLRDDIGGFGPLQRLFDDPEVEEIWINAPHKVFVAKNGRSELSTVVLTSEQVASLVERMLRASGRRLDLSSPFVDAALHSGQRLHVVIPDVTSEHWTVNIRKYVVRPRSLSELVERGMLTEQAARFLNAAVDAGLNVVVSGATQAGKTTFLAALMGAVSQSQRIITAEEVFELHLPHRDVVAMQTRPANIEDRGEVTLRRLVRESLRMRPDRIVIGEVRQAEALDMLIALNSGIPGACTLHANSAREAVSKLCVLPLLAGENVTADFVVPTVARAIDVVVHVGRDRTGMRRVEEIVHVTGRVESGVVETASVFLRREGMLVRGIGGIDDDRFAQAGYDPHDLLEERWDSLSVRL